MSMEVTAKTYKVIKCKDYVNIIARIVFKITSETELLTLQAIYKQSTNLSLNVSKHLNQVISKECNIKTSALSTAIHRLSKVGAIRKDGRTIYLHPMFNGLDTTSGIMFKLSV